MSLDPGPTDHRRAALLLLLVAGLFFVASASRTPPWDIGLTGFAAVALALALVLLAGGHTPRSS